MKPKTVILTRDSNQANIPHNVVIWKDNATIYKDKFSGAWDYEGDSDPVLTYMTHDECKKTFGFTPRAGAKYLVKIEVGPYASS